jgi:hypothetical protein
MVHGRRSAVDLSEPSRLRSNLSGHEEAKTTAVLNFLLEHDLGAGKKAYRHVWFANGSEPASGSAMEACRFQLISARCPSALNNPCDCPSSATIPNLRGNVQGEGASDLGLGLSQPHTDVKTRAAARGFTRHFEAGGTGGLGISWAE